MFSTIPPRAGMSQEKPILSIFWQTKSVLIDHSSQLQLKMAFGILIWGLD